jgi:hypothetical protein
MLLQIWRDWRWIKTAKIHEGKIIAVDSLQEHMTIQLNLNATRGMKIGEEVDIHRHPWR